MDKAKRIGWAKVSVMGLLVAVSIFLVIWFHNVEKTDVLFTHFFYVPIILASLWWGWRGVAVAVALSLMLLISHATSRIDVSLWVDMVRTGAFMVVSLIVAELSERRKKLEQSLIDYSRKLEERVWERTQKLSERNRELETYSYTVSHDLTAPLVVIEGYAELLEERRGEELGEEGKEFIERILKGVERIRSLTSALLEYARAGILSGEVSVVDPGDTIKEIVMERDLEMRKAGIEVEIAQVFPYIWLDPMKLNQVFSNLIDNAIKHMGDPPSPRIEIGGEIQEDMVVLHVRDNGVGIEESYQDIIFEPFQRLDSIDEHGIGIGLSTVRKAVEGWGGSIWVESKPGSGSTFYFSVPAAALDEEGQD